ncbi:hypothetical protein K439DRAFT_1159090 [Ramaria rubella]|nr:hypothetical protein K439DRAFT_1159090 [Ramaria rubella]
MPECLSPIPSNSMSAHYRLTTTLNAITAVPGALAFSPDGSFLASYTPGQPLLLNHCKDGKAIINVSSRDMIHMLVWNPWERCELVCGFESGAIAVLHL